MSKSYEFLSREQETLKSSLVIFKQRLDAEIAKIKSKTKINEDDPTSKVLEGEEKKKFDELIKEMVAKIVEIRDAMSENENKKGSLKNIYDKSKKKWDQEVEKIKSVLGEYDCKPDDIFPAIEKVVIAESSLRSMKKKLSAAKEEASKEAKKDDLSKQNDLSQEYIEKSDKKLQQRFDSILKLYEPIPSLTAYFDRLRAENERLKTKEAQSQILKKQQEKINRITNAFKLPDDSDAPKNKAGARFKEAARAVTKPKLVNVVEKLAKQARSNLITDLVVNKKMFIPESMLNQDHVSFLKNKTERKMFLSKIEKKDFLNSLSNDDKYIAEYLHSAREGLRIFNGDLQVCLNLNLIDENKKNTDLEQYITKILGRIQTLVDGMPSNKLNDLVPAFKELKETVLSTLNDYFTGSLISLIDSNKILTNISACFESALNKSKEEEVKIYKKEEGKDGDKDKQRLDTIGSITVNITALQSTPLELVEKLKRQIVERLNFYNTKLQSPNDSIYTQVDEQQKFFKELDQIVDSIKVFKLPMPKELRPLVLKMTDNAMTFGQRPDKNENKIREEVSNKVNNLFQEVILKNNTWRNSVEIFFKNLFKSKEPSPRAQVYGKKDSATVHPEKHPDLTILSQLSSDSQNNQIQPLTTNNNSLEPQARYVVKVAFEEQPRFITH